MSAPEKKLGDLHVAVAELLIERIKGGEASSSDLSVAVKFLKDNGIEALKDPGGHLDRLSEALPTFTDEEPLRAKH
jgi:hypothetical protein